MTAGDRIEAAARRQRLSYAEIARRMDVPGVPVSKVHSWLRGFAKNHIRKGDPIRLKAAADVLGLDYRELLALTDQLGAVEAMERSAEPRPAQPDMAALVSAMTDLVRAVTQDAARQNAITEALADLAGAVRELTGRVAAIEAGAGTPPATPTPGALGGQRGRGGQKTQAEAR